jgi:hypothetical protein
MLDGEWSYDEWRTDHLDSWTSKRKCCPCCFRVAAGLCCCRGQLLLDQPDWDYQGFMSKHLSDYLVMSQQFMAEYFAEEGQEQQ